VARATGESAVATTRRSLVAARRINPVLLDDHATGASSAHAIGSPGKARAQQRCRSLSHPSVRVGDSVLLVEKVTARSYSDATLHNGLRVALQDKPQRQSATAMGRDDLSRPSSSGAGELARAQTHPHEQLRHRKIKVAVCVLRSQLPSSGRTWPGSRSRGSPVRPICGLRHRPWSKTPDRCSHQNVPLSKHERGMVRQTPGLCRPARRDYRHRQ
jgi:hypothetical protein